MTADDVVAAARECLQTPFRHQGRVRGVALDCVGLAITVVQALGLEYIDQPGYGREPHKGQLEAAMDMQPCLMRVTSASEYQAGDILLMRFASDPQHLAIFTGQSIIHSYENVGMCCEHRLSQVWAARIVRVYRFKDLA